MNVRLDIEYDGADFHGWQRQPNHLTIQQVLEDLITSIVGKKTTVYGASRTDSGVHALGQVATFFSEVPNIDGRRWAAVLNFNLPKTIRIRESSEVGDDFHPQRDALTKIYVYRLLNRGHASALDRRVHFNPKPLDWEAVEEAMKHFIGEHDFRAFQGAKAEVRTTTRNVLRFDLTQEYEGLYRFEIEGTGFLKHMVRNIIGTLLEVGERKRAPDDIPKILASLDRDRAGRTIPPHGLCLMQIKYGRPRSHVL